MGTSTRQRGPLRRETIPVGYERRQSVWRLSTSEPRGRALTHRGRRMPLVPTVYPIAPALTGWCAVQAAPGIKAASLRLLD